MATGLTEPGRAEHERLEKIVEVAHTIRKAVPSPETDVKLPALMEALVMHRAAQDRLEEIAGQLIRLRAARKMTMQDARDDYEDKVAEEARNHRPAEFSTAEERRAHYDLKAFEEKRAMRAMRRRLEDVETALEYVQLLFRGVDSARRDLDTRVRLLTFTTRLEG